MSNTNDTSTTKTSAAELVYDDILSKIIFEVTCGVHRAAKTGILPYSNVMAGTVVRDGSSGSDIIGGHTKPMHEALSKYGEIVGEDGGKVVDATNTNNGD